MKLIINIPDDYMKYIDIYEKGSLFDMVLTGAIKSGIPLEDIKAEIEDLEPDYGNTGYGFESYYKCQSEVLKIIDKHIGESRG